MEQNITIGPVLIQHITQESGIRSWGKFPNIEIPLNTATDHLLLRIVTDDNFLQQRSVTSGGHAIESALRLFFKARNIKAHDVDVFILEQLADKYFDEQAHRLTDVQIFTCLGKWCHKLISYDHAACASGSVVKIYPDQIHPSFSFALPDGLSVQQFDGDSDWPKRCGEMNFTGREKEKVPFLVVGRDLNHMPHLRDARAYMLDGAFLNDVILSAIRQKFPFLQPDLVSSVTVKE